jgi:hypothetical protein
MTTRCPHHHSNGLSALVLSGSFGNDPPMHCSMCGMSKEEVWVDIGKHGEFCEYERCPLHKTPNGEQ